MTQESRFEKRNIFLKKDGEWTLFEKPSQDDFSDRNIFIGHQAIIEQGACIEQNVVIRQYAVIGRETVIERGAFIGERAVIGQGAIVRPDASIRQDVVIEQDTLVVCDAIVRPGAKIKAGKIIVLNGLYRYTITAYLDYRDESNPVEIIRMGCYERTRQEWEGDFWNNPLEFPNDGSRSSMLRLFGFKTACSWLDIVKNND